MTMKEIFSDNILFSSVTSCHVIKVHKLKIAVRISWEKNNEPAKSYFTILIPS